MPSDSALLNLRVIHPGFTPETFIVSCRYDSEMNRATSEDMAYNHEYITIWKVLINSNYVEGSQVLRELRRLRAYHIVLNDEWDYPPVLRDYYNPKTTPNPNSNWPNYHGFDNLSFCYKIDCEIIDMADPSLWRVTAHYGPPQDVSSNIVWKEPLDPDPFQWYWTPQFDPDWNHSDPYELEGYVANSWVEFVEDQKIVERAYCLIDLPSINRGPNLPRYRAASGSDPKLEPGMNEPGPVVNAAGQQTIDPIVEPIHRMILNVVINYPDYTYAMALNEQFRMGLHAPLSLYKKGIELEQYNKDGDYDGQRLFMGYPHGTWKFLIAEPGKPQYRKIRLTPGGDVWETEQIVEFCPTLIKLELNMGDIISFEPFSPNRPIYSGWTKQVLNNGQTCFTKWNDKSYPTVIDPDKNKSGHTNIADGTYPNAMIPDPTDVDHKRFQLFPVRVRQLNEDAKDTDKVLWNLPDARQGTQTVHRTLNPSDAPFEEPSEPINLNIDGTVITDPNVKANHILYGQLKPVNLYDITDLYGRRIFPAFLASRSFPIPPQLNTKYPKPFYYGTSS